ncbi:DNA (cytosine-5-)-methyltransferase [Corynebacterium genitalium ATCC 33030]|uniref:DNA (cytosine-5-)-methyltransferase n=1 Tax=Corynebacterium genitalium ATCC 33030 TaxID=585529 RepID=D7WDK5_9CORY|nr:DNA (cytosine-5-)-methyltransferase [Corynebacterium genitalium ATCC 33030]
MKSKGGIRREWESVLAAGVAANRLDGQGSRVVDLFSGCGGLSLGFQAAGFDVLAGFDHWEPAIETYNSNFGHHAEMLDLANFDKSAGRLGEFSALSEFPAIIGGPPCQDFSTAGKRLEDANADLTSQFAALVGLFQPFFFVMENVPNAKNFGIYNRALQSMERAGYHLFTRVLDASVIGTPQRRKRLFAIGTQDGRITNAILEAIVRKEESFARSRAAEGPVTLLDWFGEGILPDVYYRHPWSYDRRGLFSVREPSPTIRGVNRPMPKTYQWHPKDTCVPGFDVAAADRPSIGPLSIEIRKQIQTFPEEFSLLGARTTQEQMIGNAVPVLLGYFIAKCIADTISSVS